MRVLIVGVTGFAGGYLARELSRTGDEVWGAARPKSETPSRLVLDGGVGEIPVLPCDVTDAAQVAAALDRSSPEAVVLLAGLASPPQADRNASQAYAVHAMGAVNLLEETARRGSGTRVLLVTSGEIYGAVPESELPVREDAALRPTTVYASSKAAADLAGRAFALAKEVDVVRARPFNHTGPGQTTDFVCPDFAAQVASIARGDREPVIEVGNLESRRDFTDVRDVVRGYAAALRRGRSGEAYNLCRGRAVAVGDVLRDLCAIAGIEPEVRTAANRQRRAEIAASFGDPGKARAELGWETAIPWRKTLGDLLASA
ncbi:MAG: NAD-dependent epimerase/dehydratase family protein [Deltaproteobacteria bacterium]|nr:NAD-dependent epimerase/dehydratase family protein [Deltaproteobacteria bacterium]